jgi:hypothetical protein
MIQAHVAHLIPKVRRLRHMTEQTDLNNASQHLDVSHDLKARA